MTGRRRAPDGRGTTEDTGAALIADLRDLTNGLLSGGYTRTTIALLHRNLRHAVPSALGAALVLERGDAGGPVQLDLVTRAVGPAEIRSAVRVGLADLVPAARGWVDLFASAVGAFDRLAPDLVRELAAGGEPSHPGTGRAISVDPPPSLPGRPLIPDLDGLTDYSRVDHALGILLNRGYSLPHARELLRFRAERAGTDVEAVATDIINWF